MATFKPFPGLRPPAEIVKELSCPPYDVMSSEEAAKMTEGKDVSFLRITRPEIDFPQGIDIHSPKVYDKAAENFDKFIQKKWLRQDARPTFYIYAQTLKGHTQYGIVGCAACEDYEQGIIKKHELTRPDKEDDRMTIIRSTSANLEPVFFSYRAVAEIDTLVKETVDTHRPAYDFTADDGVRHQFWCVEEPEVNEKIESLFQTNVPFIYVADGHHRTAAAARVGTEKKSQNPNHTGSEAYNFFLAVCFPDTQLKIIDYNRVVKDLNGNTPENFLEKLKLIFDVTCKGNEIYKPARLHEFSMYLTGQWYRLVAKKHTLNFSDILQSLDVSILSKYVLNPILDITDLRTSKRIDFIGGIRGLDALQSKVDSGEYVVAFALYPVSMEQLLSIADADEIMPPKTTWFEPKLSSGLVVHRF